MSCPNFIALGAAGLIGYCVAMQIGIDSFVATRKDPVTGVAPSPADRIRDLLEEIEHADQAGVDAFGVGEHHRADFADSAPAVILAAAAARTKNIRLTSAVTRSERRRSGARVSGIRHGRPDLEWSRGNHRRA